MKRIPLGQNKHTIVDNEDYEWLSQWKWHLGKGGYARRTATKLERDAGSQWGIYIHRLINKTPPGQFTDHINHNTLDNRKSNLRLASKSQNNMNRGKQKNNTSGFKGVWWDRQRKKWAANIRLNGKTIHLGRCNTPQEAHQLYIKAARKNFGEYFCV